MPARESGDTRAEFANSLRGLASLSVVLYHFAIFWIFASAQFYWANVTPVALEVADLPAYVTWFYKLPYAEAWRSPPPWLGLLPQFDWGAFGVALFFVISGFVIPLSFDKYDAKGFLVGRVLRIYPTYMAGFTLTIAAMWIGGLVYGNPFPHPLGDVLTHYVPGFRDVLNSRLIDPVIWTLEIELKFYLLCGCLADLFRARSLRVFLVPAALAALAASAHLLAPVPAPHPPDHETLRRALVDMHYVLFMFVGVAFSYRWSGRLSARMAGLAVVATYGAFAALWWLGGASVLSLRGQEFPRVWSYAVAAGVFALAMRRPALVVKRRPLRLLADISYPLYVVHMAAGFLVMRLLHGTGLPMVAVVAVAAAATLMLGWVLHRLVERPTRRLGRRLARFLSMRPARPVLGRSVARSWRHRRLIPHL